MNSTSKWYEAYKSAVLETDWTKMEERIRAAESAIAERQHEFSLNHGGTQEERQAIEDALNSLRILRQDALAWSRGGSASGRTTESGPAAS
jgi:hypothetical protein